MNPARFHCVVQVDDGTKEQVADYDMYVYSRSVGS